MLKSCWLTLERADVGRIISLPLLAVILSASANGVAAQVRVEQVRVVDFDYNERGVESDIVLVDDTYAERHRATTDAQGIASAAFDCPRFGS